MGVCGKCYAVSYCSVECQKKSWESGHKGDCPSAHSAFERSREGFWVIITNFTLADTRAKLAKESVRAERWLRKYADLRFYFEAYITGHADPTPGRNRVEIRRLASLLLMNASGWVLKTSNRQTRAQRIIDMREYKERFGTPSPIVSCRPFAFTPPRVV